MYNSLGVLGDLGGIIEVIMIIFGFFLFPVSEHSFYLSAGRLLYFARTKDEQMFTKSNDPELTDKLEKYLDPQKFKSANNKLMHEIKKHHIIRLSLWDNARLFMANIMSLFCCDFCWKKKEKF